MKLGIARGIGTVNGCARDNRAVIKLTIDLNGFPRKFITSSAESETRRFLWYRIIAHLTHSTVRSSKLMLALVSIVVLGFMPRRNPWPYSCSFQPFASFVMGLLFDEQRGLTATGHSSSTRGDCSGHSLFCSPQIDSYSFCPGPAQSVVTKDMFHVVFFTHRK
jgi:hypothetical protein